MAGFTAIAICFMLPLLIVVTVFVYKSYELRKKTDLVAKALEKGEYVDADKLIRALAPKRKTIRQKLYGRMKTGLFFSFTGLSLILIGLIDSSISDFTLYGCVVLAIGLAAIASFFVGEYYLANEIEKEDSNSEE